MLPIAFFVLTFFFLFFILRDRFAKTLLLGLAFACNFGGMVTPISSMQNVVAKQALEASFSSRDIYPTAAYR